MVSKQSWSHRLMQNKPADIVSQGMSVLKLAESSLLWEGPDFL